MANESSDDEINRLILEDLRQQGLRFSDDSDDSDDEDIPPEILRRAEQSIRNIGLRPNSGLSPELRQVFLTYPHTDTQERAVDTTEVRVEEENAVCSSNNAGLTLARIKLFEKFSAGESLAGDQCPVCLAEVKVGEVFLGLGCHEKHFLCGDCAAGWFKNHKTCPICRHEFTN